MNHSIVSEKAKRIKLKLRPHGFMLVQFRHNPGAKIINYSGCVELREREHSTSFFYDIYDLDCVQKKYSFSLFSDDERRCCLISATMEYEYNSPFTVNTEIICTSGIWSQYTDNTVRLFHIITFINIIRGRRPYVLNSRGERINEWLCLFGKPIKQIITESLFTDLRDVISTFNDILTCG